jgi:hypothetical protein
MCLQRKQKLIYPKEVRHQSTVGLPNEQLQVRVVDQQMTIRRYRELHAIGSGSDGEHDFLHTYQWDILVSEK